MSSISSITYPQSFSSPLNRLQNELNSEVSAGTISSSDKSALSAALSDIDSALKSGAMHLRGAPIVVILAGRHQVEGCDNLIAKEVQSGKLTSSQATELQDVFAITFSRRAVRMVRGALREPAIPAIPTARNRLRPVPTRIDFCRASRILEASKAKQHPIDRMARPQTSTALVLNHQS